MFKRASIGIVAHTSGLHKSQFLEHYIKENNITIVTTENPIFNKQKMSQITSQPDPNKEEVADIADLSFVVKRNKSLTIRQKLARKRAKRSKQARKINR